MKLTPEQITALKTHKIVKIGHWFWSLQGSTTTYGSPF